MDIPLVWNNGKGVPRWKDMLPYQEQSKSYCRFDNPRIHEVGADCSMVSLRAANAEKSNKTSFFNCIYSCRDKTVGFGWCQDITIYCTPT
ncbi:hypothetical protein RSAG8_04604, partial [Rhizoctonia solani AG-8 WAC10335]